MIYWVLEPLRSQIHDAVNSVISKENLEQLRDDEDRYNGLVYRHNDVYRMDHIGFKTRGVILRKYIGSGGYLSSIPLKAKDDEGRSKELEQRTLDALALGAGYCVRRIHSDACRLIAMKNPKCDCKVMRSGSSELVLISMPLAPEELYNDVADDAQCCIVEKNGWYVTFTTVRHKWDTQVWIGLLVGMTLYEW